MGRVLLDRYAAGDEVTVESLDGTVLYTLATNASGVFYAYGDLPADFRIRARRAGEDTSHLREIRGGYFHGTMYINPLTTLSSLLLARNPGLGLVEAEARVRAYFKLPENYDFDWPTNAQVSAFRPAEFYAAASASGGLAAHYDHVLSLLESPTLNEGFFDSAAGKFAKAVLGDVGGDTVSLLDAGAFGAITQFFGLNLGTSGALNAISEQLDQVLSELGDLSRQIDKDSITGDYKTAADLLEQNTTSVIDATTESLTDLLGGGAFDTSLYEQLQGVLEPLDEMRDSLTGSNNAQNIVTLYNEYASAALFSLGLSDADIQLFQYYPVRINSHTQQLQSNLDFYLNYLGQAINNRAELAHTSPNPATSLDQCQTDINNAVRSAVQAAAQVPPQMSSDQILVDLENNYMWIAGFQPQASYYDANNIALNWSEGGYEDWGLPSRAILSDFVQNRIGGAKTADTNAGWEAGFQNFGFDTAQYGQQTYRGNDANNNTNVQGQAYFFIESDTGAKNQNVYQWSGVNSAPATSYYN